MIINNKGKKILLVLVAIVCISSFLVIQIYNSNLQPVDEKGEKKLVEIPKGYSLKAISSLLESEGIIKNKTIFELYVKKEKKANELQAGKYLLSPSMSAPQVLDIVSEGEVIDESIRITIPEGWNLVQIAERLEQLGLVKKQEFLDEAKNIDKYKPHFNFLSTITDDQERSLEGYLFPDTYNFSKDISKEEIIKKMLARFNEVYDEEYIKQAQSLGMTIDDIVILASVVEQESKYDKDRPMVASVFYNRLEKGMHLQSDVTVLYAMGIKKERVLYKDLEIDSRFNTYKYSGLPIGPIGSFGEPSLKAALYPANTEYYYFIAKSDGYCIFNKTFKEHTVDVNTYLR